MNTLSNRLVRFIFKTPIWVLAVVGAFVLASCYTVPQTGRSAFNVIGASDERRMGVSAFQEVEQHERRSSNSAANAMVQRVGKRIAAIANQDIPNASWEFVLFENAQPNAFALPGGKVGVYTGILEITKNEAGLAAVLGHEIAHVAARHGAERMSQQLGIGLAGAGLGMALNKQGRATQQLSAMAFGMGTSLALVLPHSRSQESEADHIGTIYMAKAGYDPNQAIAFWDRFASYNQRKGGAPPAFLSTHPTDSQRISDLKNKWVPEAEVFYKTSGR